MQTKTTQHQREGYSMSVIPRGTQIMSGNSVKTQAGHVAREQTSEHRQFCDPIRKDSVGVCLKKDPSELSAQSVERSATVTVANTIRFEPGIYLPLTTAQ